MSQEQRPITRERREQAEKKLQRALEYIDSQDSPHTRRVIQVVHRMMSQVDRSIIGSRVISAQNNRTNCAVGFDMGVQLDSERIVPVITIDIDRVNMFDAETVAAELVRTAAVVLQYPEGHKRQLREVYDTALTVQRRWLDATEYNKIPDPRTDKPATALRDAMGDLRFMFDISFDDWQQAARELQERHPMSARLLQRIAEDSEEFFFVRAEMLPHVYDTTLPLAEIKNAPSPQDRAEIIARSLVSFALKTQQLASGNGSSNYFHN